MIRRRMPSKLLATALLLSLAQCQQVAAFSAPLPSSRRQSAATSFTTALFMSSKDDDNEDDFMKSLQTRMAQIEDSDNTLPIVVLDAMLPRQVLKIEVENDVFQSLVKHCIELERPRFGMIGTATLADSGQTWPLQNGVEVEIVDAPSVVEGQGNHPEGTTGKALRVQLVAGRRFRIQQGELETNPAGWTEAKVEFLEEIEEDDEPKAQQLAQQLVDSGLIDKWIELARTKEHFEGQTDQLLLDLGDRPSPNNPSDLAFWVGALINPLPGMGVAMELRPQLLMAKSAQERIGTIYSGIEASIKHMDGTKPLF